MRVIAERCSGCGACIGACANAAITLNSAQSCGFGRKSANIDEQRCRNCAACAARCAHAAIADKQALRQTDSAPVP